VGVAAAEGLVELLGPAELLGLAGQLLELQEVLLQQLPSKPQQLSRPQ